MPTSLVRTKLYIPPPHPNLVPRPHLIARLNAGLHRKLTLLSAPAGFGKTTLLSEWATRRMGTAVGWAEKSGLAVDGELSYHYELKAQGFPLVEPLSERELQVLRLLATSLTTPEIADQLFVAASTARTHVKNIYGKLNVHRRREAVFRARELGLL